MNQSPQHFGNYRGEIIRNDDPLKAGRVKVNIFGVYDGISEDSIPWAIYADPAMGGLSNVGSAVIPEKGAHVWCFFEGGDHHYPVYWAGAPAMKDGVPDIPEESATGYPANKVRKTKSGILMEMDDTDGNIRFRIYHPSGSETLFDDGGNQIDNVSADRTSTIGGNDTTDVTGDKNTTISGDSMQSMTNLTIDAGGNVTITSGGNVEISGTMITLN